MAESAPLAITYRAFLSYAHADTALAKRLHAALEGFRIDKDLAGRVTALGPVPASLRPIFRDREDFSGGHVLNDATVAAIDASAALIVICSPIAATRHAVNEEVRLFRYRHPDRPVVPVIVDGEWPNNAPPALRYELAADGSVTGRPVTILGPDLRESGDGWQLGVAKVVAGLVGVSTDEVFRRAERARRTYARFRNALVAVLASLALAATASAVYAWQQLKTNEAFLSATLKTATEIVDEAVAQAEKYSVPRTATLSLLRKAEGLFDNMAQYGRATPELRYRKAWMLIQFARNYEILGDSEKQRTRASEAHSLLASLAAEKPGDTSYQADLAAVLREVGDALLTQGKLAEALQAYSAALAIRRRLTEADPANSAWQRDLGVSLNTVGDVLVAQGKLAEALEYFQGSLAIAERLAAIEPANIRWVTDVSVARERLGDMYRAHGNLASALEHYRAGYERAAALRDADPANYLLQRMSVVTLNKIGEVLFLQGELDEAVRIHSESVAIMERLVKIDASNTGWQRDLSMSYFRIGTVLSAQDKLEEALQAFRADLAIAERLAKADPANAQWQRDLSVSFNTVGDALIRQGKLDDARQMFRDALAIRERLAATDPANADWQYDLSISHERIGDVWAKQNKLAEALQEYEAKRAIVERLAKTDPANTRWQRGLSVAYSKIGTTLALQGNMAAALQAFRDDLAIAERLAKADPSNAEWQWDVVVSHWKLAVLSDEPARRWAFIIAEIRRLKQEGRLRPDWERLLPMAEANLAKATGTPPAPQ